MTLFKTLSMAAMLSLAIGASGAMAQSAGGGGSGGDGGGGGGGMDVTSTSALVTPTTHATVPGSTVPVPTQLQDDGRFCGYELLRGHFCEQRARR